MIKKATVIGAGLMGAGIAAHLANAGTEVLLLDIPFQDKERKNHLSESAIKKLIKTKPSPLTLNSNISLIKTGNIDDDLHLINDSEWVIEAIIEDIKVKKDLYKKIQNVMKDDLIISSNTSTIPLERLVENSNQRFKSNFFITHFFNPPRYLRLLEIVSSKDSIPEYKEKLSEFCDVSLGKSVIHCNDTPGFIGNRIGVFWMIVAANKAIQHGLTVEEADQIITNVFGAPKTGVFGLLDVVGLDLMPHVLSSMIENIEKEDEYHKLSKIPDIVKYMLDNNLIGRKGIGGFYKLENVEGKRVKMSIDLKTKEYSLSVKSKIDSLALGKKDLRLFLDHDDKFANYAWSVLSETLLYTLNHAMEISNDLISIDDAMRNGFGLKFGPFELIDKLGKSWLTEKLSSENRNIPEILKNLEGEKFYIIKENKINYLNYFSKEFEILKRPDGVIMLSDYKKTNTPIKKIPSASLWDLGDGITVFELHSRGNSIDINTMKFLDQAIDIVSSSFSAMIIYNEGSLFSAGANVGEALFLGNIGLESELVENIIENGQKVYQKLKYSKFPVVAAPSSMALGGGCELLLHCDYIQAHIESYIGLTEAALGICPGWGGCKELLYRLSNSNNLPKGPMPAVMKAFETIGMAKTSTSALEAKKLGFLKETDGITMNRDRLLFDAKSVAMNLIENYEPPEKPKFNLPGKTGLSAMTIGLESMKNSGQISDHDKFIGMQIANVLSGENVDLIEEVDEEYILNLESKAIQTLFREPKSQERIETLLETGKVIRN
tara:strand:- start:975 stop:3299 length:2325 start_codon:yes stop_codon:yes gene_type:complete